MLLPAFPEPRSGWPLPDATSSRGCCSFSAWKSWRRLSWLFQIPGLGALQPLPPHSRCLQLTLPFRRPSWALPPCPLTAGPSAVQHSRSVTPPKLVHDACVCDVVLPARRSARTCTPCYGLRDAQFLVMCSRKGRFTSFPSPPPFVCGCVACGGQIKDPAARGDTARVLWSCCMSPVKSSDSKPRRLGDGVAWGRASPDASRSPAVRQRQPLSRSPGPAPLRTSASFSGLRRPVTAPHGW